MCKKELPAIYQTKNFLEKKIKSSLKFKINNWDFGREEWNNYHCKYVFLCKLVERNEIITEYWGEKEKSNKRTML